MSPSAPALDRLHVELSGRPEAPPLLMLHGWGSSAALMQPLAGALSDAFRVHNVDLPGHGQTPPPPEPWGVPEYGALVARYVEAEMGGGPIPLVGHSNGGRIGLYLASEPGFEGLVGPLVLVAPSGVTPRRTALYHVKKTVARVLRAPFEWLPPRARAFGLDWLRHSLVWKWLGSSDYSRLSDTMRGTFVKTVNFYLESRLPHVHQPVLIFWGTEDRAVARDQMETMARLIPDAGLFPIEGAGHYAYLDALDIVAEGTKKFLMVDSSIVDG